MVYLYVKDLLNKLKVRSKPKKVFPAAEEQNLVDFHSDLIDNPSLVNHLNGEETYRKVKLIMMERKLGRKIP